MSWLAWSGGNLIGDVDARTVVLEADAIAMSTEIHVGVAVRIRHGQSGRDLAGQRLLDGIGIFIGGIVIHGVAAVVIAFVVVVHVVVLDGQILGDTDPPSWWSERQRLHASHAHAADDDAVLVVSRMGWPSVVNRRNQYRPLQSIA